MVTLTVVSDNSATVAVGCSAATLAGNTRPTPPRRHVSVLSRKIVITNTNARKLTRQIDRPFCSQAKAVEFLRERGEAAKSEQAGLSPTADANPSRKDRSLLEAFLSVRDGDSSRLAATTGPAPTAAAATRDGNNSNDVRSLAVAAGENTLKVSSTGAGVGVRGVLQSVGSPTASSSSFSYPRVDSLPSVAAGAGKGEAFAGTPRCDACFLRCCSV